jgi:hypothetical protein
VSAPTIEREGRLVVVRFLGGVSDAELRAMLDTLEGFVRDEALRPAFVFDVSRGVVPPAAQRRMMGEWLRKHSAAIRRHCVASAYVLPNAGLRGMLTAILWIAPHPIPHLVCKSAFEGRAWARSQLQRQSAPPPL